jgi:hypothetical protein
LVLATTTTSLLLDPDQAQIPVVMRALAVTDKSHSNIGSELASGNRWKTVLAWQLDE